MAEKEEVEMLPVIFERRKVRRVCHDGERWFAVEDVCAMLMDKPDGLECWRRLRQHLEAEGCEIGTLCHALEMPAPGGTTLRAECVTLEGVFRIVQSISSPRAEVFKRWLAQAGREEMWPQGHRTDTASIFALLDETVAARIAER